MTSRYLLGALSGFMLFSAAACGDDSTGGGPLDAGKDAASGGKSGSGGASSGGTSSGGTSSGGTSSGGTAGATGGTAGAAAGGAAGNDGGTLDGGGGTEGGGSGCNYLVQLGAQVNSLTSTLQAPAPQGGAIADGFYKLTAVNLYGGATGTTFWRTLRFVGTEMKTVERDGTAVADWTSTGTYVANGHKIVRTLTCPAPDSITFDFTAGATSFTAYETQGPQQTVELIYDYVGP